MCHIDCFLDFLVCQTVFLENLEKNVDHREISLDSEIPLRKLHLSRTKLHPFPLPGHSVGRNPAPFDSLSMFIPSFTTGFIYPNGGKGLGISEPSTVRFPITCTEDRIFSSSKRRSRRRSAFYASWLLKDSSWKIVPQVTQVTNKYIHIIYTYMYVNIHIYIYIELDTAHGWMYVVHIGCSSTNDMFLMLVVQPIPGIPANLKRVSQTGIFAQKLLNNHPRKLQHTRRAHPRQYPQPAVKGIPL